jgi:hypothetical protein
MTIVMLIAIRSPLGAALGGDDVRTGTGDRKVREIRASSAPLLASDLAGFRERRRHESHGGADLLDAWVAQFPDDARGGMRDWLEYHDARTGRLTGGWRPAPGCTGGRWRLDHFGHTRSYLLGANDEQ